MIAKIIVALLLLGTAGAYFGIQTPVPLQMEVVDKYTDSISQRGMTSHIFCVRVNRMDTNEIRKIGKGMFKRLCDDTMSDTAIVEMIMHFYLNDSTEAIPEDKIAMALLQDPTAREKAKQFEFVHQGYVYVGHSNKLSLYGYPPESLIKTDFYKPSGGRYRYKTLMDKAAEERNKRKQ